MTRALPPHIQLTIAVNAFLADRKTHHAKRMETAARACDGIELTPVYRQLATAAVRAAVSPVAVYGELVNGALAETLRQALESDPGASVRRETLTTRSRAGSRAWKSRKRMAAARAPGPVVCRHCGDIVASPVNGHCDRCGEPLQPQEIEAA